jgi:hypothetical protein
MVAYKAFYKNYDLKKDELIGMLIERRKDLREMKRVECGLRWAKLTFGRGVKDEKEVFIVPYELNLGSETKWLVEKGIINKEELRGILKLIGV